MHSPGSIPDLESRQSVLALVLGVLGRWIGDSGALPLVHLGQFFILPLFHLDLVFHELERLRDLVINLITLIGLSRFFIYLHRPRSIFSRDRRCDFGQILLGFNRWVFTLRIMLCSMIRSGPRRDLRRGSRFFFQIERSIFLFYRLVIRAPPRTLMN